MIATYFFDLHACAARMKQARTYHVSLLSLQDDMIDRQETGPLIRNPNHAITKNPKG
jgi:hypothetical protein